MEIDMTILNEIAEKTKERVAQCRQKISLEEIRQKALACEKDTGYPFEKAMAQPGLSFICEVKKASPSKGLIAPDFPYVEIAKDYEKGGARAISVLTEPFYFQGSDRYLQEVKQAVSLPVIRKDFVVDEYMIYEAKVLGADAVLLICAILSEQQLKDYFELADSLGLTALVEAHDRQEVEMALRIGARLIGVNNRDLHTFTVDIENSLRYRQMVPDNVLFVSESGIRTGGDVAKLAAHRVDGVLIGETMMVAGNRVESLQQMIQAARAE